MIKKILVTKKNILYPLILFNIKCRVLSTTTFKMLIK
jgi:hypothetical protein